MSWEYQGKIENVTRSLKGDCCLITFSTPFDIGDIAEHSELMDISIKKHRNRRSLDANGLLWKCLSDIAQSIGADRWQIYLQMLRRYGQHTYICVPPQAVEATKRQWRECEELGEIDINGRKAIQLICYFGSSQYNTKEFSILLDAVISEMREMGLRTPADEEMDRALELWEREHE